MGDIQQQQLIQSLVPRMEGPVLEIGSKRHGGPPAFFDYRTLFGEAVSYVGIDLEPGAGVDVVVDMSADIALIREQLLGVRFNTLICLSVMEHVKDIYAFARNVDAVLSPGALLVISVPFVWEVHAFPSDYWRFTPAAVEFLFPSVAFDFRLSQLHTDKGHKASLAEIDGNYNEWLRVRRPAHAPAPPKKWRPPLHGAMFDMVGFKTKLE